MMVGHHQEKKLQLVNKDECASGISSAFTGPIKIKDSSEIQEMGRVKRQTSQSETIENYWESTLNYRRIPRMVQDPFLFKM